MQIIKKLKELRSGKKYLKKTVFSYGHLLLAVSWPKTTAGKPKSLTGPGNYVFSR
jgi:hypothetical protein